MDRIPRVLGLFAWDERLFRWVNHDWAGPVLDVVMPFLSGNRLFFPALVALSLWAWFRCGRRGRCCLIVVALVVIVGEGLVTGPLKKTFRRERPFLVLPDTRMLSGKGLGFAMPSGHSALWAGAAVAVGLFYPRSRRFMIPLAASVGISRMYVGVHWPTDVVAGWATGTAYGFGIAYGFKTLWDRLGSRWFPQWWRNIPDILVPEKKAAAEHPAWKDNSDATRGLQWQRLAYLWIGFLFLARIGYLATGKVELSEDEAYQWLWSKHLDLSYYSKPAGIAVAQWFGTSIFGDTELGVRFLSPVLAALGSIWLFRWITAATDSRTGFIFLLLVFATPLLTVGSFLITVDPLTVFFWTVSMLAGWRAVQEGRLRDWGMVGLGFAGSFLSKYFSPFQWGGFALFFLLHPAARRHLRTPGPYLALAINLVATLPVILWNQKMGWITARHLHERGGLSQEWEPTLRYFFDFVVAVPLLLNPVLFAAGILAAVGLWKQCSSSGIPTARDPRQIYLFCMSIPVLVFYLLYTFRARVQPNWICTAAIPLLALATLRAHQAWKSGGKIQVAWLCAALVVGMPASVLLHDTKLVGKLIGKPLPPSADPMTRVRGYRELSRIVGEQRNSLLREGKPVFIITHHYGIAGLISFYLPEARKGVPDNPLVYARHEPVPKNQLWFWPGYQSRTGENALYVEEIRLNRKELPTIPERLRGEFQSIEDLGTFDVPYREQTFHRIRILACRGKR